MDNNTIKTLLDYVFKNEELSFSFIGMHVNVTLKNTTTGKHWTSTLPNDHHINDARIIDCINFMRNKNEGGERWEKFVRKYVMFNGKTESDLREDKELRELLGTDEVYMNNQYQVFVYRNQTAPNWPAMIWLSIKRLDKEPIRDWRDMQRIKNELVGEENEGVEMYPAESRLVDTANQYHMWVIEDKKLRFPFGFTERMVNGNATAENVKQRQL